MPKWESVIISHQKTNCVPIRVTKINVEKIFIIHWNKLNVVVGLWQRTTTVSWLPQSIYLSSIPPPKKKKALTFAQFLAFYSSAQGPVVVTEVWTRAADVEVDIVENICFFFTLDRIHVFCKMNIHWTESISDDQVMLKQHIMLVCLKGTSPLKTSFVQPVELEGISMKTGWILFATKCPIDFIPNVEH